MGPLAGALLAGACFNIMDHTVNAMQNYEEEKPEDDDTSEKKLE